MTPPGKRFAAIRLPTILTFTFFGTVLFHGIAKTSNTPDLGQSHLYLQTADTNSSSIPTGYASLQEINTPAQESILSNPLVSAISLRSKWPIVEPRPGVFNWSFLDSEIARAAHAGKSVILRIASGGVTVPGWVYEQGAQSFSFTDQNRYHPRYGRVISTAVPWDPIMLKYKKELIRAMGERYANNPAVKVVGEACANSNTEDWHLPNAPKDVVNWIRIGYTPNKLIDAGKQIIDASMAAFPNQAVVMSFNNGNLDRFDTNPDANYVQNALITYARERYGKRFIVQKNTLCARTPRSDVVIPKDVLYTFKRVGPPVTAQMLWFVTGDPTYRMGRPKNKLRPRDLNAFYDPVQTLQTSIAIGLEYGTVYQEVYAIDLLNPQFTQMLSDMRKKFR
jgi:hypothetical protein